jgi:hypothetical protein
LVIRGIDHVHAHVDPTTGCFVASDAFRQLVLGTAPREPRGRVVTAPRRRRRRGST